MELYLDGIPRRTGNLHIEIGSNETIKQAVMAGLGIALISGDAIAAEIADGRMVALDVPGLPIMRQWFVLRRSDRTLSTAAGAFFAFLRERGGFRPRKRGARDRRVGGVVVAAGGDRRAAADCGCG